MLDHVPPGDDVEAAIRQGRARPGADRHVQIVPLPGPPSDGLAEVDAANVPSAVALQTKKTAVTTSEVEECPFAGPRNRVKVSSVVTY